jgi:flagellar basal-body rod modification protein FlgD
MGVIDATSQKMDFMTLLVTELQYQNPLEPMDNQQMAAQLAQFSQLELTEGMNGNLATMNETMTKMNTSFEGAMWMAELDYAKSLLGKTVNFATTGGEVLEGQVKKLTFQDGSPVLTVSSNNQSYVIQTSQIQGIQG